MIEVSSGFRWVSGLIKFKTKMALKISPVYFEKIKKASFAFRMKSGDRTENLTELRHNQLIRLTGM